MLTICSTRLALALLPRSFAFRTTLSNRSDGLSVSLRIFTRVAISEFSVFSILSLV